MISIAWDPEACYFILSHGSEISITTKNGDNHTLFDMGLLRHKKYSCKHLGYTHNYM